MYAYRVRRDDGDDSAEYVIRIIIVNGTYRGDDSMGHLDSDMHQRIDGNFYSTVLERTLGSLSKGRRRIIMSEVMAEFQKEIEARAEAKAEAGFLTKEAELTRRYETEMQNRLKEESMKAVADATNNIARGMLADKQPVEKVMKYTKLSREDVLSLMR